MTPRNAEKWLCTALSLLPHTREYNPAREYRFVSNVPDNNIIPGRSFPPGTQTRIIFEPSARVSPERAHSPASS